MENRKQVASPSNACLYNLRGSDYNVGAYYYCRTFRFSPISNITSPGEGGCAIKCDSSLASAKGKNASINDNIAQHQ